MIEIGFNLTTLLGQIALVFMVCYLCWLLVKLVKK
jgi:hypothetical protein